MSRRVTTAIVLLFLGSCLFLCLGAILSHLTSGEKLLASSKVKINLDGETAQATANIIIETKEIQQDIIPDIPEPEFELPEASVVEEIMPLLPELPGLPSMPTVELPEIPWEDMKAALYRPILALKVQLQVCLECARRWICSLLVSLHSLVNTVEDWVRCNLTENPPYSCR